MIGWMQNWDTCNSYTPSDRWCGQMSIPRELSVRDGRLYQLPAAEIEKYRGQQVSIKNMKVSGNVRMKELDGRYMDLTVNVKHPADGAFRKFEIRFFGKDDRYASVSYDPYTERVTISRAFSGIRRAIVNSTECNVDNNGEDLSFRMILDRYSVEVFINGGRYAMTMNVYNGDESDEISFAVDGEAQIDIERYELKA
jgi:beta-fructofuranosidase